MDAPFVFYYYFYNCRILKLLLKWMRPLFFITTFTTVEF